jgi:hypothetical protein
MKRTSLKWESICHKILLLSKFYGREVTFQDLKDLNPKNFKYFGDIKRDMLRLELASYIVYSDKSKTKWRITNVGVAYLYEMAKIKRLQQPIVTKD